MSEAAEANETTPVVNDTQTPPTELHAPVVNGAVTPAKSPGPERNDDHAYAQIIESLRSQNNELFTQVPTFHCMYFLNR